MTVPEPTASSAVGAGLLAKYGAALGAGLLGALVIAAFDPPKTRKEVFGRAACAGVGSMVFGPFAVRGLSSLLDWFAPASLSGLEHIEMVIPVYFVLGAVSWGMFGALASLNRIIKVRGGRAAADRVLGKDDQ